jgi:hypothetical protein
MGLVSLERTFEVASSPGQTQTAADPVAPEATNFAIYERRGLADKT